MDMFMRNVPYTASSDTLTDALAAYIHSPAIAAYQPSGVPTNFRVNLFANRQLPNRHKGYGTCTVAYEAVGRAFLSAFGNGIIFGGRHIKFSLSKKPVDINLVQELRSTAFENAGARRARLERQELLAIPVQFQQLAFGLVCREDVFSPEIFLPSGDVLFQAEDGSIELRIANGQSLRFRTRTIDYGVYCRQQLLLILDQAPFLEDAIYPLPSNSPPIHEDAAAFNALDMMLAIQEMCGSLGFMPEVPTRVRVGGFTAEHEILSPYICKALLLTFPTVAMLQQFIFSAEELGAPRFYEHSFRTSTESNLKIQHLRRIEQWEREKRSITLSYQIRSVMLSGRVFMAELVDLLPLINVQLDIYGCDLVCNALRNLVEQLPHPKIGNSYESVKVHMKERFILCVGSEDRRQSKRAKTDSNLFQARHLVITPCSQLLEGPFAEQSNLILRRYGDHQDNFLRVSFLDENRLNHRNPQNRDLDQTLFLKRCVGDRMKAGFQIGPYHFDFLGYTMSALHEHTAYFVCPFFDEREGLVTAQRIRDESGDYSKPSILYCPARYGARLSQNFTTTESTQITLRDEEVVRIGDVERNDSCFTDGAGTASSEILQRAGDALAARQSSRSKRKLYRNVQTLQVRIGGAKGMLVLDSRLKGSGVCLRPSMEKFMAEKMTLEVAGTFTKPISFFLYRSLIGLLSDGGVKSQVFLELQADAVREANRSKHSIKQAVPFLESNGLGVTFRLPSLLLNLRRLLHLDIGDQKDAIEDEFLDRCFEFGITHVLRNIKHKARVLVPDAVKLVGVPDMYDFIPPGCIYARIEKQGESPKVLSGTIAISRSLSEHPLCTAISNVEGLTARGLLYSPNCVLFSTQGDRSLPSCLGGGDLDGDLYDLIMDKRLHPSRIHPPASYPPAKQKTITHPCVAHDVIDFFCDYLGNDLLGIISTRRLHVADQEESGSWSNVCKELAGLASKAVDFQKSGTPVRFEELAPLVPPLFLEKPDFLMGEIVSKKARYYESSNILGQLYRAITLPRVPEATKESAIEEADSKQIRRLLHLALSTSFVKHHLPFSYSIISSLSAHLNPTSEDFDIAFDFFTAHCRELRFICAANSITTGLLSEEEAVMGVIMEQTTQPKKRQDASRRLREQTEHLVKATIEELSPEQALVGWQISLVAEVFGSRSFGIVSLGSLLDSLRGDE